VPEVEVANDSDDETPKNWSELEYAIDERNFMRKHLPIADPSAPLLPPYKFHDFEIERYVLGGMGMVLLGYDPGLKRRVALKLLQSSGDDANKKLIAEAQKLAKLDSHPNVVTVYAIAKWAGGVFFVMEYVDGMNGQEWLELRPPWQEVLDVFLDAGEGLAGAHKKEIQHGDFKPANMLIGKDGRTRVADFGIANYLTVEDDGEQPTGRMAGTAEYMAPERLRGHEGDARSDQYSFCVSLWRGLHGSRPFPGKTAFVLLDAIEAGSIDPQMLDPRVPHWLTAVVRKGLAENPDDRYRDMPELLDALRDGPPDDESASDDPDEEDDPVANEGPVLHVPATPAGAASDRYRWPIGVIGVVSVSALVLSAIALTRSPAPEPPANAEVVNPYHVILGLVADDKFAEAEDYWRGHLSEVTDEESLRIARACLDRSRLLVEPTDRDKADEARWTAVSMADHVAENGKTKEVRDKGRQLRAEARPSPAVDRPSSAD
jgi:hypothetical protein